MSTNASIMLVRNDGTTWVIYNHWDGYPTHLGKVLIMNIANVEDCIKLLEMGDASFLDADIFSNKSVFYNRDRDEDTKARVYDSFNDAFRAEQQSYTYVFFEEDDAWTVYDSQGNEVQDEYFEA